MEGQHGQCPMSNGFSLSHHASLFQQQKRARLMSQCRLFQNKLFSDLTRVCSTRGPVYTRTLAGEKDKIFYRKCLSFRRWRGFWGMKTHKSETTLQGGKVWQAIPARKRHHLDTYHLHYAVKNAVKCRKTPYFTPSCAKKRRFLRRN
jgi:hypothetical protein